MRIDRMTQEEMLLAYRELARGTGDPSYKVVNRCHDRLHRLFKVLYLTPEGREAIELMTTDPDLNVRFWAAAHTLAWRVDIGRPVLEAIRDGADGGMRDFEAKWALIELDAGRLKVDY